MSDLPWIVKEFLLKLTVNPDCYTFVVMTSNNGKSGNSFVSLSQALSRSGANLSAVFDLQMPGNCLISSEQENLERLKKAPERVDEIVEAIRQKKNPSLYCAGSAPLLKSYMVYPLFTHFAIGSNRFYATDTCISCGICAKVCPTGTISLSGDGKPEWADTCVQCVACIHRCPVRAIEYGTISLKKGRYHHPEFK